MSDEVREFVSMLFEIIESRKRLFVQAGSEVVFQDLLFEVLVVVSLWLDEFDWLDMFFS